MKEVTAGFLEKHLIEYEEWSKAPAKAYALALEQSREGVPTGIALYEGKFFVIQSSGQGPYLIWKEDDQ